MIYIILQDASDDLARKVNETLSSEQAIAASSTKELKRDMHHRLATKGTILFSDRPEDEQSPLYVGKLEDAVIRAKDMAGYMEGRLSFFNNKLPANYVGRVYDDPKNIIVGDSGKIPMKALVDIVPDNWWGSLGFLTEYEPRKLFTVLEMYLPNSNPIAISQSAYEALTATGLDFVDAREYPFTREGGLRFRESTTSL